MKRTTWRPQFAEVPDNWKWLAWRFANGSAYDLWEEPVEEKPPPYSIGVAPGTFLYEGRLDCPDPFINIP